MLIIARTTGVQTVVMNGDSNTRVIWQCLGRNGKTERSRVVVWKPQVVPDGGTRNRKRPPADCRETNRRNVSGI